MSMNIIVNGAGGHMGREVVRLIRTGHRNATLAAAVDPVGGAGFYTSLFAFEGNADCIIDFSHHTSAGILTEYATRRGIPLVIATTGHTESEKRYIHQAARSIPVFFSGNTSLGIAVLRGLVRQAVEMFPGADVEIIERHHNRKIDVPSATALMLADSVNSVRQNAVPLVGRHSDGVRSRNEIGIHSLRMGNTVGVHEVIISTASETLTLRHEAHDRALYAEGALTAAEFIVGKKPGLYDMGDIFG